MECHPEKVSELKIISEYMNEFDIINLGEFRVCVCEVNEILVENNNIQIVKPTTPITTEPEMKNEVLLITSNDIIKGVVTKNHTLTTNNLDCSLFDHNGIEVSVGFQIIDSDTIKLIMGRVVIPNGKTWKILLEG